MHALLAALIVASGFAETDPMLANAATGNYRPCAGSPAIGFVTPADVADFWKYAIGGIDGGALAVLFSTQRFWGNKMLPQALCVFVYSQDNS